jgi:hypothetical protein
MFCILHDAISAGITFDEPMMTLYQKLQSIYGNKK